MIEANARVRAALDQVCRFRAVGHPGELGCTGQIIRDAAMEHIPLFDHPAWAEAWRCLGALPRTGFLDRGFPRAHVETVLQHTAKLVTWMRLIGQYWGGLDTRRMIVTALVHDVPEYVTGDYKPNQICKIAKSKLEWGVWMQMRQCIGSDMDVVLDLVRRYEARASDDHEAHLVHQMDKVDCYVQALRYAYLLQDFAAPFIGNFKEHTLEMMRGRDRKMAFVQDSVLLRSKNPHRVVNAPPAAQTRWRVGSGGIQHPMLTAGQVQRKA